MTSLLNIAGNIPVVEAGGQSLRFEDGDSAYMTWTPATAGNRKTWTWSGWVKRANLLEGYIFGNLDSSALNGAALGFTSTHEIIWLDYSTGYVSHLETNAVFRDVSAWYHLLVKYDTAQATASDRIKIYVNNVEQSLLTSTYPSQNYDGYINNTNPHAVGRGGLYNGNYLDGYLANVCFIDGQALDPTSFGEYDDTLWRPKSDADITNNLTFGTNGFYLPFKQTTEAEGFSTVTYTGNGGTQSIEGVGFEPDFVWIKARNFAGHHVLVDSVRGTFSANRYGRLFSNTSGTEDVSSSDTVTSLDADGFGVNSAGSGSYVNDSGDSYVAWCWDAGSGSPVSNTDGSITSTVKANTAKGFSIGTVTTRSQADTIGHGLSQAPDMVIFKPRNGALSWGVYHSSFASADNYLFLEGANSVGSSSAYWNSTAPTSTVFSIGGTWGTYDAVFYAFHSVSGYSSIGSYSGDGTSNGSKSINLGFKPAFVMIKRTNAAENWMMLDTTRNPSGIINNNLYANLSNAESDYDRIEATATGFDIYSNFNDINASGSTYIYMAFADTRDATFFGDTSGNGNNWTPNALNNTDVVPDSPVSGGNFAVLNEVHSISTSVTFSEGNLKAVLPTASSTCRAISTIGVSSGKWYWEASYIADTSDFLQVGVCDPSNFDFRWMIRGNDGESDERPPPSGSSTTASTAVRFGTGDIIGIALDADNGKWYIAVNGTWQLSADFNAGTGYVHDSLSGELAPVFNNITGSGTQTIITNFGQDSSFAGTETPQGNTDDNGVGDFYYAPPSGFLALTTGNLPTPTITAPDEYFNTVLYTGTGATQSITGVGFQPSWLWLKNRSTNNSHALYDSVRGSGTNGLYGLSSNTANAELDGTNVTSLDSDGFTLGSNAGTNGNGNALVAWNWLAGNGTVSNTDGSITSTVSANQAAGFSVVSYTGTGSAATVGHGLSSAPDLIIVKNRDTARNWTVYNSASGATKYLLLNTTNADQTGTSIWNDTAPTSSVFSVGTSQNVNYAEDYIAYCFHSVEGYSKIGSYTGNGSATDGVYVALGFRASFIMVKRTDASADWKILDNTRNPYNLVDLTLEPNKSTADQANTGTGSPADFLANGIKFRGNGAAVNASGGSYIFLAFAEAPFKSANAR